MKSVNRNVSNVNDVDDIYVADNMDRVDDDVEDNDHRAQGRRGFLVLLTFVNETCQYV